MSDRHASLIAARAVTQPDPDCPACGGVGWYIGHEDECYDTGDCVCSGVQVECGCVREPTKESEVAF